jgi:hypothetical protein
MAKVTLMVQEVPLTDEEISVAEGDVEALNRYIENPKASTGSSSAE